MARLRRACSRTSQPCEQLFSERRVPAVLSVLVRRRLLSCGPDRVEVGFEPQSPEFCCDL